MNNNNTTPPQPLIRSLPLSYGQVHVLVPGVFREEDAEFATPELLVRETRDEFNTVTESVSTLSVADASPTASLNNLSNTQAQAPVSCLRKAESWYSLAPLLKRFRPHTNRIRVKFDSVKVREHARTVGDSSMPGPFPLGLDWEHGECTIYSSSGKYLRSRERERQLRSRVQEESILPDERFNLLLPFSDSRDALLELEFRRIEQMQSEGHRHLCPDYNDLEIDPEEEQWHADQDKKRFNHQEALEFLIDKSTTTKNEKTSPPRRSRRIAVQLRKDLRQGSPINPYATTGIRRSKRLANKPKLNYRE
jgi:hypothetical protein